MTYYDDGRAWELALDQDFEAQWTVTMLEDPEEEDEQPDWDGINDDKKTGLLEGEVQF